MAQIVVTPGQPVVVETSQSNGWPFVHAEQGVRGIAAMTQAEYDAAFSAGELHPKTVYVIVPAP